LHNICCRNNDGLVDQYHYRVIWKIPVDIPWNRIENRLNENSTFENNMERLVLYEIILEELQ
jgi:hypothetical protein